MLTKERVTKVSRLVQRSFAQRIEMQQPSYSWIHARVSGDSAFSGRGTEVPDLFARLLEEWRTQCS